MTNTQLVHLEYWYTFRRFLESQQRPENVNNSIRALFETEKRMLHKQLLSRR